MLQMFVLALSLYNTWNRGVFLLCKITNLLIYSVVFKTGVTRADCEKFNEAIFTIMEEDLKIPKENVYTTFQYCDDFGVQGKFL